MYIKTISKNNFYENAEFFKKGLGDVFNFDNFEDLKDIYPETTPENFQKISKHAYQSVYTGYCNAWQNTENRFLVIACDKETILAIATFEKHDDGWFIYNVTTRRSARRQGYSESILKAGIKKVKQNCFLYVDHSNARAATLYEKLGFVRTKEKDPSLDTAGSFLMVRTWDKKKKHAKTPEINQ